MKPPRGPQEATKRFQKIPKTAPEALETPSIAPKTAPKGPQDAPKMPPRGPKRPPRDPTLGVDNWIRASLNASKIEYADEQKTL